MKSPSNSTLIRFLLLFACGWAITQILVYFETVVVIFSIAALAAFLLSYPVNWLNRILPKPISVIIVFFLSTLVITGVGITIGITVISQGQQLSNLLSELLITTQPIIQKLQVFINERNIQVDISQLESEIRNQFIGLIRIGLGSLQGLISNLFNLAFIGIVSFFMLLDGGQLWQLIINMFPSDFRERLTVAIKRNLLAFFWGRFILAIFFTVTTFIILVILQVPFAIFLSVVAGLFDFIPGIGSTIGIGLICLLIMPQSLTIALQVLVACFVIKQIEENLLLPHILRNSINISPVVMFIALLIGAKMGGLLGIFLAIPFAGVVMSFLIEKEVESSIQIQEEE